MTVQRKHTATRYGVALVAALAIVSGLATDSARALTIEEAVELSKVTGRPIFALGGTAT
jgi:hypothetical protein